MELLASAVDKIKKNFPIYSPDFDDYLKLLIREAATKIDAHALVIPDNTLGVSESGITGIFHYNISFQAVSQRQRPLILDERYATKLRFSPTNFELTKDDYEFQILLATAYKRLAIIEERLVGVKTQVLYLGKPMPKKSGIAPWDKPLSSA